MTLHGYLLGLGSNLNPQLNMAKMVAALLAEVGTLTISRVIHIPPIGMNSQQDFLNAVIYLESELDVTALKAVCNQIEIALGRDRNDPDRKTKDRPADIDILCSRPLTEMLHKPVFELTDEYFLYPVLEELRAYLSQQPLPDIQPGQQVQLDQLTFGQTATTIHR